jgi:hypothetical protein
MLNSFFSTGKMDLMQWSQPTFLGVVPLAVLMKAVGQSYSWCGLLASFSTMVGIFVLAKRYTSNTNSLLLALSPLCQLDFVMTMPTIMSDQFFLAFFIWSFVGIDRFVEQKTGSSLFCSASAFALSALIRAHGYLLFLSAVLLNYKFKNDQSRKVTMVFGLATVLTILASLSLTTNRIPLERATSLPDVLIRHEFALFDLRAMFKAVFETLFALTPAIIISSQWKRFNRVDLGLAAVSFVLCLNFCMKGVLAAPIWHCSIWIAPLWVTILVALLSQTIRSTPRKSYMFSLCCLVALGTILIMPISPHPLTRHALPALVALLVAMATSEKLKNERIRLVAAGCVAIALIASNYLIVFNQRMENKIQWEGANKALANGIQNRDLFVNWDWFCAHDLIPGKIENYDYHAVYEAREQSSKYVIVDGRLIARH